MVECRTLPHRPPLSPAPPSAAATASGTRACTTFTARAALPPPTRRCLTLCSSGMRTTPGTALGTGWWARSCVRVVCQNNAGVLHTDHCMHSDWFVCAPDGGTVASPLFGRCCRCRRAMAELLEAAVSRGVMAAAAAAETAAAAQQGGAAAGELLLAHAPVLPPPMITDNYEANATSCHLQVCAVQGWRR